MASDNRSVRIDAQEFHATALPVELRFAPPYAQFSTNPSGFSYWWQLMRYVFDLPNPRQFPALPEIEVTEKRTIGRYIVVCKELSSSSVVSHLSRVRLSFSEGGSRPVVDADLPSAEALRGTTVLFRQLSAPEERASYSKVRKILGRHIHTLDDEHRDQRKQWQTRWNRAHGQLRANLLTALADRNAANAMGAHPSIAIPGEEVRPEQVLSLFQYGELIHWGEHAEAYENLTGDEFLHKWTTLNFIEVVVQLSHFYLGYSLLAAAAIGQNQGSDF